MYVISYIVETILYGAKELTIGLCIVAGIFVFFAVLIVPPMASFQSYVDGNMVSGTVWFIVALFVYGAGFRMSNHGG